MQTVEPQLDPQIHPMSIFDGKFQTRGFETGHATLEDLFAFIAGDGHDVRHKKDGKAFNLNVYVEDSQRHESNIIESGGIVLDIDKLDPSGLVRLLEKTNQFKSICYTTYSHKLEAPRVRLVFPLAEPIRATAYKEYAQRVADHLDIECDGCSLSVNQFYYLPAHPPESQAEHFIQVNTRQDFLDVALLLSARRQRVVGVRPESGCDERQLDLFAFDGQSPRVALPLISR